MINRINLWSCPRNISTAFMYSFAQRADTRVWDEPLYGHFLERTGVERPDRAHSMSVMELDGEAVVQNTLLGTSDQLNDRKKDKPIAFFKHITNQLIGLDPLFLTKMQGHILFIRNPREIIASYSKVIEVPTMDDVAIRRSVALYRKMRALRVNPIVLNSRELLNNPEQCLRLLCNKLNIPWDANMLQWKAGPRKEDGPWAKYWYAGVHKSTGFARYNPKTVELGGPLEALAEECQPYYDYLEELSLRY
jgi:hypothetical protein